MVWAYRRAASMAHTQGLSESNRELRAYIEAPKFSWQEENLMILPPRNVFLATMGVRMLRKYKIKVSTMCIPSNAQAYCNSDLGGIVAT